MRRLHVPDGFSNGFSVGFPDGFPYYLKSYHFHPHYEPHHLSPDLAPRVSPLRVVHARHLPLHRGQSRRPVRALPAWVRRPIVRSHILRALRRRDIRRPEPHGLRPLPPQHLQPRRRRKLHCLHDRRLKARLLLVHTMQAWRGAH